MDYTKLSEAGLLQEGVFSKAQCRELINDIKTMERARWYRRTRINSRPTKGTSACQYWFCGDRQQPAWLREKLFSLAPEIAGAKVVETCVNHYEVGDWMPEHIDYTIEYRYNMVVNLCEEGDGIEIEGEFYPDVAGRAVVFPIKSAPHAVPPVHHERYCIVYLYE